MRKSQITLNIDFSTEITPKDALKYAKSNCFGKKYLPGEHECDNCSDNALCCIAYTLIIEAKQLEIESEFHRADLMDIDYDVISNIVEELGIIENDLAYSLNKFKKIVCKQCNINDDDTFNIVLKNICKYFFMEI